MYIYGGISYGYDVCRCPPFIAAYLCNVLLNYLGASDEIADGSRWERAPSSTADVIAALERHSYQAFPVSFGLKQGVERR